MSLLLPGLFALLSLPGAAEPSLPPPEPAPPITGPSQLPPEPVPVEEPPDAPPALPPGPLPDLRPVPGWFFSADVMFLQPTIDRPHDSDPKISGRLPWAPMPRVGVGFGYEETVILGVNYRFLQSDGTLTVGEGTDAVRHDVRLETHFLDLALMTRSNDVGPDYPEKFIGELGVRTLWLSYSERGPDGVVLPSFDRHGSFSAGPYLAAERNWPTILPTASHVFSRFEAAALFGDAGHLTPVGNLALELGVGWSLRWFGDSYLRLQTGAHLEGLMWRERTASEFGFFARGAFNF